MDMLAERLEVLRRRPRLPALLGPASLDRRGDAGFRTRPWRREVEATGDADLELALRVERGGQPLDQRNRRARCPRSRWFGNRSQSMEGKADVMVVSATPREALEREWSEHGLSEHVALLAGQELGSKKEHLALAAGGRYEPDKILMVGDALGDWDAARGHGSLFYPIDPGLRGRVVAAVLRGGPAPILRR